jgi:hypothetical protein
MLLFGDELLFVNVVDVVKVVSLHCFNQTQGGCKIIGKMRNLSSLLLLRQDDVVNTTSTYIYTSFQHG